MGRKGKICVYTAALEILQIAELYRLSKPRNKEYFISEGTSGVHLIQPPLKPRLTSRFSQVAWDLVQTDLHSPWEGRFNNLLLCKHFQYLTTLKCFFFLKTSKNIFTAVKVVSYLFIMHLRRIWLHFLYAIEMKTLTSMLVLFFPHKQKCLSLLHLVHLMDYISIALCWTLPSFLASFMCWGAQNREMLISLKMLMQPCAWHKKPFNLLKATLPYSDPTASKTRNTAFVLLQLVYIIRACLIV